MCLAMAAAGCGDSDADGVSTTTTAETRASVESVVATAEADMAAQFEALPEPPSGVIGPMALDCSDSGAVAAGDVFACVGRSPTEAGTAIEPVGVVFVVVDDAGTAAWTFGTDVPESTSQLLDRHGVVPRDLSCEGLAAGEADTFPFGGAGRPADDAFFWTLAYWFLEGRPARLDPDADGVPCETAHEPDAVSAVLAGGPV
jgi:hypothetical protein